jgi:hypothetical protein
MPIALQSSALPFRQCAVAADPSVLPPGSQAPERKRPGQGWNVPTNRNLRRYLRDHMGGLEFSQTYATNVFPFIKIGKKNAAIRATDMRYAAEKYALPASRIVQRSR